MVTTNDLVTEEWVQKVIVEHNVVRRIVCAANRASDGDVVCSARHHDVRMNLQMFANVGYDETLYDEKWRSSEQGFIDQWGLFHTREQAWKIAKAAGQIFRVVGSQVFEDDEKLFSENLY